MASKVNGFLYMPWLVKAGLERPDGGRAGRIVQENALPGAEKFLEAEIVPEVPTIEWKSTIGEEGQQAKMHQLTLY